jgi:cytochrome P450
MLSTTVTHRLPELYDDPDKFLPDRYLENPKAVHQLIGFGGGMHRCLGMHFAHLEMQILITRLLQAFDLELVNPDPQHVRGLRGRWPQSPCRVRYRKRAAIQNLRPTCIYRPLPPYGILVMLPSCSLPASPGPSVPIAETSDSCALAGRYRRMASVPLPAPDWLVLSCSLSGRIRAPAPGRPGSPPAAGSPRRTAPLRSALPPAHVSQPSPLYPHPSRPLPSQVSESACPTRPYGEDRNRLGTLSPGEGRAAPRNGCASRPTPCRRPGMMQCPASPLARTSSSPAATAPSTTTPARWQ